MEARDEFKDLGSTSVTILASMLDAFSNSKGKYCNNTEKLLSNDEINMSIIRPSEISDVSTKLKAKNISFACAQHNKSGDIVLFTCENEKNQVVDVMETHKRTRWTALNESLLDGVMTSAMEQKNNVVTLKGLSFEEVEYLRNRAWGVRTRDSRTNNNPSVAIENGKDGNTLSFSDAILYPTKKSEDCMLTALTEAKLLLNGPFAEPEKARIARDYDFQKSVYPELIKDSEWEDQYIADCSDRMMFIRVGKDAAYVCTSTDPQSEEIKRIPKTDPNFDNQLKSYLKSMAYKVTTSDINDIRDLQAGGNLLSQGVPIVSAQSRTTIPAIADRVISMTMTDFKNKTGREPVASDLSEICRMSAEIIKNSASLPVLAGMEKDAKVEAEEIGNAMADLVKSVENKRMEVYEPTIKDIVETRQREIRMGMIPSTEIDKRINEATGKLQRMRQEKAMEKERKENRGRGEIPPPTMT